MLKPLSKRSIRYLLIAVVVVSLGTAFWLVWRSVPDYSPIWHVEELYVSAVNERLYVSFEQWGVTYDRQLVIISTKPKRRSDYTPSEDYAFHTSDSPILYSINADTLTLYTAEPSAIPRRFTSRVQVKQRVVDLPHLQQMERDRKQLGLVKVGGPDYKPPSSSHAMD